MKYTTNFVLIPSHKIKFSSMDPNIFLTLTMRRPQFGVESKFPKVTEQVRDKARIRTPAFP